MSITKYKSLTVGMAAAAMLTACFTGIESTPRITNNDVRQNTSGPIPEDTYLSDIKPQNIRDWQPGKAFYVTDERIGLAVNLSPANAVLAKGDTLRFRSVSETMSIMGMPVAEILLDGPGGLTATYRSDASLSSLEKMEGVTLPFTVELTVVDSTRSRLMGKEFWVITSEWLDGERRPRRGRKFVKVRVNDVAHGDDVYPVCLQLVDFERQPADTFNLLMNPGSDLPSSSRRFASLLALDDPHKRYPQVSDANWELIRNGRVAEGMTRLEARLSLGQPKDIQRQAGYSSLAEIWKYDNGTFLIFEDGLLKRAR